MQNTLKKRVMRRVYTIWFIRKATPAAGELGGMGLMAFWGLKYISPAHILINAFSAADGLQSFAMFFVRAFLLESAPAQFALIVSAVLGVIVMRDVFMQIGRIADLRQKLTLSS